MALVPMKHPSLLEPGLIATLNGVLHSRSSCIFLIRCTFSLPPVLRSWGSAEGWQSKSAARGAGSQSADFLKREEDGGGRGINTVMRKRVCPWQLIWIPEKEGRLQDEPVYLSLTRCKFRRQVQMSCPQARLSESWCHQYHRTPRHPWSFRLLKGRKLAN